jgi:murein DD-endopeptidase MepM/ murein hydrolase activator NlpD
VSEAPTPPPRRDPPIAGWLTAAVAVVLLAVGGLAFFEQRDRAEPSDDVTFNAAITSTATIEAATVEATGTATAAASATVEAATVTGTPSSTPASTPTDTPTATPTALPETVLQPEAVGIGETFAVTVRAPGASGGAVLAGGLSFPLLLEEEGLLFAVVGVPLNAALGPATASITLRDASGAVIEERAAAYEVVAVERPVDYLELTAEESSVLTPEASALERTLRTEQFVSFDGPRRWTGPFRVPVEGFPTTAFGQGRSINGGPVGGFHSGADIANEAGTLVHAAAPGRVSWAGEMPIRGNTVLVDHGGGVKTGYHHLQAILVEVGQEVAAGVVVGEMGSTGLSTGPHLHWELTIYGVNVDPMTWSREDFTP